MLEKINFRNGVILSSSTLNEVQKGTTFNPRLPRDNYYGLPTTANESIWYISERDGIKDWELADPDIETQSNIGRLAYDGVVLGCQNCDIESLEEETTFLEIQYGPPRVTYRDIDGSLLPSGSDDSRSIAVFVNSGSYLNDQGQRTSWGLSTVIVDEGTNYIYFDITNQIVVANSVLPNKTKPHIPLALLEISPLVETDEEGNPLEDPEVSRFIYTDLRPGVFIYSDSKIDLNNREDIVIDDYTLESWERIFVDTSNGSVNITLPLSPVDGDRVAIFDVSGRFDIYPVSVYVDNSTEQTILREYTDWELNKKFSNTELIYYEPLNIWIFSDHDLNLGAKEKLGDYISCGGIECIGTVDPEDCPDNQQIPAIFPNPSEGFYEYGVDGKCYKHIKDSIAIYSDGEGGFIKVFDAPRCDKSLVDPRPLGTDSKTIYVDSILGNDGIENKGLRADKPLRTIERALLEAVKGSSKYTISLAAGEYYIDNRPSLTPSGIYGNQKSGFYNLLENVSSLRVLHYDVEEKLLAVYDGDQECTDLPLGLELGRVVYNESGAFGTIVYAERDKKCIKDCGWRFTLEGVYGEFKTNELLYYNDLSSINSSDGGVIVPKGVSIIGSDIRKTTIRPIYVPSIDGSHSYIFKLSSNSYISDITIGDNLSIKRSHDKLTSLSFVSQEDMIDDVDADNRSYYYRISALINDPELASRYQTNIDSEIVAPAPTDKSLRSQDTRENLTGDTYSDKEGHPDLIRHPGAISIPSTIDPESLSNISIPDINSSYSGSPYVRNCTVRSIFGLNGLHADGSLVSGFKSIIADSVTIISIQVDPDAYVGGELGYNNDPTSTVASKEYKPERRNFAYKASNQAFIQSSSAFVVGAADHFVTETGGEISLIGSSSNFGDTSLKSSGFYKDAFTQDYSEPSLNSLGTRISQIIPPKEAGSSLKTKRVFTGLNFLYTLSKSYYQENSNENTYRLYLESSDLLNPLTENVPPNIESMGGYTYTKRNDQNTLYLSGGNDRRNYVYITGVDGTVYKALPIINSESNDLDDSIQIFKYDPNPIAQLQENTTPIGIGVVNLTTNNVVINITSELINQAIQSIKRNSFIEINNNLYQVATVSIANNIATISLLDTLSTELISGRAYTVNSVKNATVGGRWYIEVEDSGLDSSVSSLFISNALSSSDQELKIQDNQSIFIIRDIDSRLPEEKIYRVKLEGYISSLGLRLPQTSYIIQKQEDLSDGLISEQNPYVLTKVESTNSDGVYLACIVRSDQYRKSQTNELFTTSDFDDPENYSLEQSITKDAIESFLNDFELELLNLNRDSIDTLVPSNFPYTVYVRNRLDVLTELRIKLHRPSLIRSSSHQWEWVGYLAYDTALPKFQGPKFSQEQILEKQFNESAGGLISASGNDQDGTFYINNSVVRNEAIAPSSEATSAITEITEIAPQDTLVVNKELRMEAGSSTYLASNSSLVFYGNNYFLDNLEQPINIESNYSVLATNARAGLTQLSDTEEVINSLRETDPAAASDRVITSSILASEGLKATSTKRGLVSLATDPDDENEEFKVVTPALLNSFFNATADRKGFVTLAPPGRLTDLDVSDVAVVPSNLAGLYESGFDVSRVCDIRLSHSSTSSIPTINNTDSNYLSSIYVHGSQIGLYDEVSGWFIKTINGVLSFNCNFLVNQGVFTVLSNGQTYELFLGVDSNNDLILSAQLISQTILVEQDKVLVDSVNRGKRYVGRLTVTNETQNSTTYLQYLGGELNNLSDPDESIGDAPIQPTIGLVNYYNRKLAGINYILNNELEYNYKYINNLNQTVYNEDFSSLVGEIDITTNYNSLINGNLSITNGKFNKETKNTERFVRVYDYTTDTTAWATVGAKISAGTEPQFKFMDMSRDGTTVAVGSRTKNESVGTSGDIELSYDGAVRIYRLSNSVWTRLGNSDIDVKSSSASFKGYSVCLSSDGNTLLVRTYDKAVNSSQYTAQLRAYTFSNGEWSQPVIVGSNSVSDPVLSNGSIDISDNGLVIAESYGTNPTQVRVYAYDTNTTSWLQKGNDITGTLTEKTGWSISLSSDGSKIAIGSPGINNNIGQARVYSYNSGTTSWDLVGTNNTLLVGTEQNDYYGFSVSLSSGGNMLSVGAPGAYKNRGFAKIYSLVGDTWTQLDGIIEGIGARDEFGASVSLSSEASKVVSVGARFRDSLGENSGQVISYSEKSTGAPWTAKGLSINGYGKDYEFGWLVNLSSTGTRVAIGTKDGEQRKELLALSEDSLIPESKPDAIAIQVKPTILQKSGTSFTTYTSTNYYTTGETSYEISSANSAFNFTTNQTTHRIKLKYDYRISSVSDENLIPEYDDTILRKYKLNLTDDPHSKNGMIVTVEV